MSNGGNMSTRSAGSSQSHHFVIVVQNAAMEYQQIGDTDVAIH